METIDANDQFFIEGLERASNGKWLGNFKVVNSLLRIMLNKVMTQAHADGDSLAKVADEEARKTARILLGLDPSFPGPDWNSPGKIDVYVGRQEGVESNDPEERVAGGLVNLIDDVWTLVSDSLEEGLLDEQWLPEVNEQIRRYTCVMMGLPQGGYSQEPFEGKAGYVKHSPFRNQR